MAAFPQLLQKRDMAWDRYQEEGLTRIRIHLLDVKLCPATFETLLFLWTQGGGTFLEGPKRPTLDIQASMKGS